MWYLTWILGLCLVIVLVTAHVVSSEAREAARDADEQQKR